MKNETRISSEALSHLSGEREPLHPKRDDEDKHQRWLKNSMWMTTFMMSVIKDAGLGCTGCAPANEIWNRASEHMSKQ